MVEFLLSIGRSVCESLRSLGAYAILLASCVKSLFTVRLKYRRQIVEQLHFIGTQSLPVVVTTGSFAGAVFAYSLYNQFESLGVASWTSTLVMKMLTWHLGPVLTSLVLAGRVGCAITAELGTMKVTEQVDALQSMGIEPLDYLIAPRVLAGFIMTPVLAVFSIFIGMSAGLLMIVGIMGGEAHYQIVQLQQLMVSYDYVQALTKAAVFGVIIAVVSCRYGLSTSGGAKGVGQATTDANVSASIAILVINMIVTVFLNYAEPLWNRVVVVFDNIVTVL